jgi:kumamolisin
MPSKNRLAIAGSDRNVMRGAREVGICDPYAQIDVTVRLRSRAKEKAIVEARAFAATRADRKLVSREEFARRYGAAPDDMARLESFAREQGLTVKEKSEARRTVVLNGPASAMQEAFGVELKDYEHPAGRYRGRTGPVYLPSDLQPLVQGVFGLDNRPQAKPHFRRPSAQATTHSFSPVEVAALYAYPTAVDGTGECVALIELGGGYTSSDLSNYWKQLSLKKTPTVSAVSVGNGSNAPTGDPNGPDAEVMLDIEVVGAIANGAKIVVYFAENTDAGFLNAITTAAHDTTNKPSVISISWGGPESSWTQQAMTSMDDAFQSAASMGITVCVASGDSGSTDGVDDGSNHVDFPASSPHVLACGGTKVTTSGNTITAETVWNELSSNSGATGGGISDVFPLPDWQSGAGVPPSANSNKHVGRGVPDIAGDADPNTGYNILVDGQSGVIGGTSAVAPLWAALIALANQSLGTPTGLANPLLYKSSGDTRDITTGNNGAYSAKTGWDACTGLGSPNGAKIVAALKG